MPLLVSVCVLNKAAELSMFSPKRKCRVDDCRAGRPPEPDLTCSRAPALTVTSVLYLKIQTFHKTAF